MVKVLANSQVTKEPTLSFTDITLNIAEQGHQVMVMDLGVMPYSDALALQKEVFEKVRREELPDTVVLVEHPHTYTLGKSSDKTLLLYTPQQLQEKGIEVFEVSRGGYITYHGFGQLVAYPILNMHHFYLDVHRYLRDLEEVIIEVLKAFDIEAGRKQHPDPRKNYTGVWVGEEKICAIGVKFAHWTTMHGLALNVNTDLSYFNGIIPCGLSDKGITSMEHLAGKEMPFSEVKQKFISEFAKVFGAIVLPRKVSESHPNY